MRFPQIYSLQLLAVRAWSFLDTQVSLAPTHVSPSIHCGWLARHSRLRIDGMLDIVADMEVDKVADMVVKIPNDMVKIVKEVKKSDC